MRHRHAEILVKRIYKQQDLKMKKIIRNILQTLSPRLFRCIQVWRYERFLPQEFRDHIHQLKKGSLVIDIGANAGLVSEIMAKTGADVLAFEPNRQAAEKLTEAASRYPNIKVNIVAAGIKEDTVNLYLHKDKNNSKEDLTQASSLKAEKLNVSQDIVQPTQEIDMAAFLKNIDRPIDLIKIDIEGYEIELVNHLLDNKAFENVGKIYLETHERQFAALEEPTSAMKARIKDLGLADKFFYDWH